MRRGGLEKEDEVCCELTLAFRTVCRRDADGGAALAVQAGEKLHRDINTVRPSVLYSRLQ
jgi:hypothetical protein